jgi:hypothetical protein
MDKPNILSVAPRQLCDAISNFQTPTFDPLNVTSLASGNTGAGHDRRL